VVALFLDRCRKSIKTFPFVSIQRGLRIFSDSFCKAIQLYLNMNLFFRQDVNLKTHLHMVEVYNRLVELIGKEDSEKQYQKKYVGKVFEKGFYLKKIRKNWWWPPVYYSQFSGVMTPESNGTSLEIKVRPDRERLSLLQVSVVIFLIWVLNSFVHFAEFPPANWITLSFCVFVVMYFYLAGLYIFNRRNKKIINDLISHLEAESTA
jgi:hypothetical protein